MGWIILESVDLEASDMSFPNGISNSISNGW